MVVSPAFGRAADGVFAAVHTRATDDGACMKKTGGEGGFGGWEGGVMAEWVVVGNGIFAGWWIAGWNIFFLVGDDAATPFLDVIVIWFPVKIKQAV